MEETRPLRWGRVLMPEAFVPLQTPSPVTCQLKVPLDATYLERASFPSEAPWNMGIAASCLVDATSLSYSLQEPSKSRPFEFGNFAWTLHSARITGRSQHCSRDSVQEVRSWHHHFKIQCFFQFDCLATSISSFSRNVNKPSLPLTPLSLSARATRSTSFPEQEPSP